MLAAAEEARLKHSSILQHLPKHVQSVTLKHARLAAVKLPPEAIH